MKINNHLTNGKYNPLLIITLICIITVISFLEIIPDKMQINDSVDYFSRYKPSAENIYYNFDFNTIGYYVPGYPIILSFSLLLSDIFSIHLDLINHLFQLLFYVLASIFIFKISNLFIKKKFAIIPSIVWLSYPPNLYMMKQLDLMCLIHFSLIALDDLILHKMLEPHGLLII